MTGEASVAPRERVNITYKPATGGAQAEKELPFKLLVLGDFAGREQPTPIEERRPADVRKENLDEVLAGLEPRLELDVADRIVGTGTLGVALRFRSLADFAPEAVARQVPQLRQLLELREALTALKGPLGNVPAFRRRIQELVADETVRTAILADIGQEAAP
jgi:type VI secretion system protein ImpB